MITADAIVCHLVGDYAFQSDWMAQQKVKSSLPALAHVVTYTLPFLFLTTSWKALLFILATHFVIDRWRLARYVCWLKNFLAPKWLEIKTPIPPPTVILSPDAEAAGMQVTVVSASKVTWARNYPWEECVGTGYHKDRPLWMSVWLLILADNTMHVCLNGIALTYLQ